MATPINPGNVLDFDQPLNTNPDFTSTHVFSTADITGTYDGATQGVDGGIVDFTGTNGTKVTKEGVTLYPIDSEFGFYVTDFVGAEDKVIDGDYAEGWAGDFTVGGVQAGVVISDSPTDTFKTPAVLGTWLAGLGGNTVKASTEHYSVMQHVLSDQEYPGDTEALYELDDNLIMLSLNPAYNGQYVADLVNGTALYEGNPVVVEDVNIDGVVDIKDLLNPNESTIAYDIAYGDDYSVTMKDDGKLLYRWGNTIKRPNDVRLEAHLETPDEWKELDLFSSLKKLYKITSAELVTHHTITNNPNDQIRPEDYENESAIGTLPTYEVIENYNGETGRTVWASTDDYYAGDGTLYVAGTILRDTMLVAAVSGSIPDLIGTMAEDLELGFTNEWYTTMDREPFEPVLSADGTEYITGPRWRLLPDKYGQDLPSVTIPLDPSDPPPVQEGEEKYEVGAETQTVINLLDWETQISPLSISAGWQDNSGEVSINGLNMTEDFDVAFYIKGDIKPASLYSTELLVDYEEIQIYASGAAIVGTAADDYLVGVGLNEFTGGAGADLFVLSYGTTLTDVITASVVVDFEVGVDKLGLIGFDSLADFDIDLPVEAAALIVQGVSGDDLTISVDGQLVATLTGVAAALGVGATLDAGEGLSLLDSFIITNPSEGVDPGPVEPNVITGTSASETLTGTTGDDIIYGLAGNDYIYALAGDDVLDGGAGLDRLYGGPGADDFVFGVGTGIDFVYGFEDGIDQIQLDGIDFADVTIALYRTSDVMVTAGADIMILRAFDVANLTVDDFIPDPGLALG
ncbi:calcium-binding protein [Puniceibacterium sediminis]|nr:calcium-binding protein [Puniceibacterium sediminis]